MSAEATVGVIGGVVGLVLILGRLLWALHKLLNVGQDLRDDVSALHATVNNGLTTKVENAAAQSARAQLLAADAARAAAVAEQHASEGRQETIRSVNALRSELDVYTNVVLSDRQRIRAALRELGQDLDDDEEN